MGVEDYKPKGMATSTRNMWGWDFGRYDKILMVIDDCRYRNGIGDYESLPKYYAALDALKMNWTTFMQKADKDKYDGFVKMYNYNYTKAMKILNNTKQVTKYFAFAGFWLKQCDNMLMFIKQFKGLGLPIEFKQTETEKLNRYLLNNNNGKVVQQEKINFDPSILK